MSVQPSSRRRCRQERGTVALEFALVMPILLVVVLGIVDFGFVLAQQLALGNGARQGARFAVVDMEGRVCGDIETHTRNAAASVGMAGTDPTYVLTGATGTCERPCEGSAATTDLTVTLTYRSEFVIPMPIPGFPSGVDLDGTGVFRCEYT